MDTSWSVRLLRVSALPALFLVSACGAIPTAGPSVYNVNHLKYQHASEKLPKVALIDMDAAVSQGLLQQEKKQSFTVFGTGRAVADSVNIGDVLDIVIWEASPAVLFGGSLRSLGAGESQRVKLPEQMVSEKGTISVPYVGDVYVVGKTPSQIQRLIQNLLYRKANQPQVLVRLAQNNAQTVSVIRAGNSVSVPLSSAGIRVLDAVAAVGGSTANVQDTNVQLTRGDQVSIVALEDLVANPRQNIYLKGGDILTLITNPSSFTALGAVGKSQQIGFSARGLSLAEAVGRMGGLEDRRSDARGVFVFRYAPLSTLPGVKRDEWLAQGYTMDTEIPIVYRVNLSNANSLFWMQHFPIKNKDVIYVSNAPLVEVQKFLQVVLQPATNSIYYLDRVMNW